MRSSDWSSYVCSSDLSLTRRSIRLWILGVSASEVRFMKIGFASSGPEDFHSLSVLVGKVRALTPPAEAADQATGGQLRRALSASRFVVVAAQLADVICTPHLLTPVPFSLLVFPLLLFSLILFFFFFFFLFF